MARSIVLCLDGTWNKPGQKDRGVETKTNVLKLHEALTDHPDQIREYFPGVGTDPGEKVSGGAFGWGLFDQIKDGDRKLREHFEPGDRIYIFGFSRGAYSARSLGGMIAPRGVLRQRVNVAGSKVEQVWFVGAHSNVGGGYADSGLSDIAFKWMVDRASVNGLQFALAALRLDPKAKRRDSLEEFIDVGGKKKNRFFAWIDKTTRRFVS